MDRHQSRRVWESRFVWAPASAGALGVVLVLISLSSQPASGEVIDRVLAIVSSHAVLESDVRAARELRLIATDGTGDPVRHTLDAIIERWLMLAEVDRYAPPEPSAADIDRALLTIRERFPTPEPYQAALTRAGVTESHLRGRLRDDLRIAAYLDERFTAVVPTEEAVQTYYAAHAERFTSNGRVAPLEDVRPIIASELAATDRQARVAQWIAGLRQRAQIIDRYQPSIPPQP